MKAFLLTTVLSFAVAGSACSGQGLESKMDKTVQSSYGNIDISQARKKIENGDIVLLDVRTPGEHSQGFIKGALLMDVTSQDFNARAAKLDKSKTYVVYCQSGRRSVHASKILSAQKFDTVFNVQGGFLAWKAAGYPMEK